MKLESSRWKVICTSPWATEPGSQTGGLAAVPTHVSITLETCYMLSGKLRNTWRGKLKSPVIPAPQEDLCFYVVCSRSHFLSSNRRHGFSKFTLSMIKCKKVGEVGIGMTNGKLFCTVASLLIYLYTHWPAICFTFLKYYADMHTQS